MVNMGRIVLPEAYSELRELHNIMLTSQILQNSSAVDAQ